MLPHVWLLGVHFDIASYNDLAHALELKSSVLAAKTTLGSTKERRETRGRHNHSGFPEQDPNLQVNLVWSADGTIEREDIPPIPEETANKIGESSWEGKLVGSLLFLPC